MDLKKKYKIIRATNAKEDPERKSLLEFVERSELRTKFARKGVSLQRIVAKQDPSTANDACNGLDTSGQNNQEQTSPKRFALSKLMKRYHSTKRFNEDIVAAKENNLTQYFKEKVHILQDFLGEEILNENLFKKLNVHRDRESREEDLFYDQKMDLRDRYLMKIIRKETYEKKMPSDAMKKVLKMNRQIGMKILSEEHEKKMGKLQNLQMEHNMQILSEGNRAEFGEGKAVYWLNQRKEPMPKMILKTNFVSKNWLKEFVERANQRSLAVPDEEIFSRKSQLQNLDPSSLKFKSPFVSINEREEISYKASKINTPHDSRAATPFIQHRNSGRNDTADTKGSPFLRLSKPHEQTYTRHASTGRIKAKIGEPWTDGKAILNEETSFIEFKQKKELNFKDITPVKRNQSIVTNISNGQSNERRSRTPLWLADSQLTERNQNKESQEEELFNDEDSEQSQKETLSPSKQISNGFELPKRLGTPNKADAETSTLQLGKEEKPSDFKASSPEKSKYKANRSHRGDDSQSQFNYMAQPKILTIRFEEVQRKTQPGNSMIPKFHTKSFSTQYGNRFWSHTSELL